MTIDFRSANPSTRFGRSRRSIWFAGLAACCFSGAVEAQTIVPTDAKAADPTCTVTPAEFNSWFAALPVTANGVAKSANSLTFPDQPNCSFYKWSEQMFLWLTSPSPPAGGGGSHVFASPGFFDVSPLDPVTKKRTFSPIVPGQPRVLGASISQLGPRHQPVLFDQAGRMFNLVRPQVGPDGFSQIKNRAGQEVDIARTEVAPGGKPVFLDKAGKAIEFRTAKNGGPMLLDRAGKQIDFRRTTKTIAGQTFFENAAGDLIDTSPGQADGKVLMSQNNSLVYYALQVNDVFAYFLTGQKNGKISATKFPTVSADLTAVTQFAASHNKFFADPNALALELKSSWVETSTLPPGEVSKYITINAMVPKFIKTSDTLWTADGVKPAELAMVGLHVVGSTRGHPEMIWATFEHVNNTRNAPYKYLTAAGSANGPADGPGPWNFSTTPSSATPNKAAIAVALNSPNLIAASTDPGAKIAPSDLLRINPWGMPGTSEASNTEVISINHGVRSQLVGADVRKNYILTGATWTIGGAAPNPTNQVGTKILANTTMESYFQTTNCFGCHTGDNMLGRPDGGGLSHIYGPLTPLFP